MRDGAEVLHIAGKDAILKQIQLDIGHVNRRQLFAALLDGAPNGHERCRPGQIADYRHD